MDDLWFYFAPIVFVVFIIILVIASTVSDIIAKISNAAKWLGIGAIAGNVINNKINSSAAVKQGRKWEKINKKTNNNFVDGVIEFVSPSTISDEDLDKASDSDYQEFLEYKKWKESQSK